MGRPFLAPPGNPADRAAALRTAFMETMKDPAFIADAEKAQLEVNPARRRDLQDPAGDRHCVQCGTTIIRTVPTLSGVA